MGFIERQYKRVSYSFSANRKQHLLRNKQYFLSITIPQSERDFVKECFIIASREQIDMAIAIHKSIADLGNIEPNFIRAETDFESLSLLEFWENCGDADFDSLTFIDTIGNNIGMNFTNKQIQSCSVRDPDLNTNLKISDFIKEFYEWYIKLTP